MRVMFLLREKSMNARKILEAVVVIPNGGWLLYRILQSFCEASPGFAPIAWTLMSAYITGAAVYFKQRLFE